MTHQPQETMLQPNTPDQLRLLYQQQLQEQQQQQLQQQQQQQQQAMSTTALLLSELKQTQSFTRPMQTGGLTSYFQSELPFDLRLVSQNWQPPPPPLAPSHQALLHQTGSSSDGHVTQTDTALGRNNEGEVEWDGHQWVPAVYDKGSDNLIANNMGVGSTTIEHSSKGKRKQTSRGNASNVNDSQSLAKNAAMSVDTQYVEEEDSSINDGDDQLRRSKRQRIASARGKKKAKAKSNKASSGSTDGKNTKSKAKRVKPTSVKSKSSSIGSGSPTEDFQPLAWPSSESSSTKSTSTSTNSNTSTAVSTQKKNHQDEEQLLIASKEHDEDNSKVELLMHLRKHKHNNDNKNKKDNNNKNKKDKNNSNNTNKDKNNSNNDDKSDKNRRMPYGSKWYGHKYGPKSYGPQPEPRKGNWSESEDNTLRELVHEQMLLKDTTDAFEMDWAVVSKTITGRNVKQCRERWMRNLEPSLKKGEWEQWEDDFILREQNEVGNKWAQISRQLEGRTEHTVKTRWHSMMRVRNRCWTPEDDARLVMYRKVGLARKQTWDDMLVKFPSRTKYSLVTRFKVLRRKGLVTY